ncbi:methylmalonyl-CoA mutase family protein [Acetonema longum]|uniref:Methylmalonyl-CoA mutase large subunit n=1 Tax=Acetonema longum DSM 6540 TaxID=1009370 RepID=F7NPT9_9FIRM|nr:methylmalonyl-CoA mutase family protein [Acetonema longum]EGO61930.1 methylmalonyl-CoA mutase large subunit [Acetonema longum DSM 6540]
MKEEQAEPMAAEEKLFAEFAAPTYESWQSEAEKALKGAPFESRLITKTYEEIDLKPIYRQNDLESEGVHLSLPGSEPFVRGIHAGGYLTKSWLVAQECDQPLAAELNQTLKNELSRGLQSLHIRLDTATCLGLDPDIADAGQVGDRGFSLACLQDLTKALDDISLQQWSVMVPAGARSLPVVALFAALARSRGMDPGELSGSIVADPLGALALQGQLTASLPSVYDELAAVTAWAETRTPYLKTIRADGCPYHDAGANAVQELAYALATAVEYVRELQQRGLEFPVISRHMQFSFALGANMFMELAKIRAARLLWSQAARAFGGKGEECAAVIHGRTSRFTKTGYDPYVNMLRTTTEAFAGVVAGLDSLHVGPFDEAVRPGDEFSRRIARNTQIILQQECGLMQPADPAGGSWYVETLTADLARRAWEIFQQVEMKGGMFLALQAGLPQSQSAKTAQNRFANLAKRRDVIVGTNMYANLAEHPLAASEIDCQAIQARRAEQLTAYRQNRATQEQQRLLTSLAASRQRTGAELVEAAIDAAIAGGSVGEIFLALRREETEPLSITPLQPSRLSEPYEALRRNTEKFKAETGGNVRIFSADIGPIPQHKPRADFSRGFFEVGAFEVLSNNGFASVDEAADTAAASGADAVVICSTDATYPEIVPPLARLIKEKMPGVWLVLAGLPPEDLQAVYREAGVDEFIHVRADCYESLSRLQRRKGMHDDSQA